MVPASPIYLCLTPSAILLRPRSGWGGRVGTGAGEGIGWSIVASFRLLAVLPAWHPARVRPPQPSNRDRRRLTLQGSWAFAIANKKIEILLLVNMPSLLVRLGKNYGKRSTAEHESAAQGCVDKPNNLT
jgi:hypothetical protein